MPRTRRSTSLEPTVLKWITEDDSNKIRLLIIGETKSAEPITTAILGKFETGKAESKELGLQFPSIEILRVKSLEDDDDINEMSKRKIHYILVLINPSESNCLDRAEFEFSRLHVMFHASRRVEIHLTESSSMSHITTKQFNTFCERYRDPLILRFPIDDEGGVKHAASILYNRLQHITTCFE